ncbi:MAG: hypothetical protein WKF50_05260 [Nocardioides sp.]
MTDTSGAAVPRLGALVIGYAWLMAAALLILTVSTLPGVRSQPGMVPFYDDCVQCTGYVLATGAAVWRVIRYAEQRVLWTLVALALALALALGLRAFGFVHTIVVLERKPVYPSLADAGWVLSALVLLAAGRGPGRPGRHHDHRELLQPRPGSRQPERCPARPDGTGKVAWASRTCSTTAVARRSRLR